MTDNGQRILVVDDEPSITDAVATSLRYEGFTVDVAETGRAALAAAQERPPDLLVLDVMLPDLDGLEVTRRLRADGIGVPVLFLTARDSLEDKVAGLTIGGDDYVTKPFALAEIIARVRVILRRTGGERGRRRSVAGRRPRDGRGRAHRAARRQRDPAHRDRVQPPPLLHAEPPPGALQVPDPRPRLALRLRGRRQRGRDLRLLPAQEARARTVPRSSTPSGSSATPCGSRTSARRCRCGRGCWWPSDWSP